MSDSDSDNVVSNDKTLIEKSVDKNVEKNVEKTVESNNEEEGEEVVEFSELGLVDVLCDAAKSLGWKNPTRIQKEAIPLALEGKDIIGKLPCYGVVRLLKVKLGWNSPGFLRRQSQ